MGPQGYWTGPSTKVGRINSSPNLASTKMDGQLFKDDFVLNKCEWSGLVHESEHM